MARKKSLAEAAAAFLRGEGRSRQPIGRTGAERAAIRLAAKARANAEFYRDTPPPAISRQVQRSNARKGR